MSVVAKFVRQGPSNTADRSADLRAVNWVPEMLSSEDSDGECRSIGKRDDANLVSNDPEKHPTFCCNRHR